MSGDDLLQLPTYDPNALIDAVIERLGLKNDAALSRVLEISPAVISKMRRKVVPIGASVLLRLHEASGLSIKELRRLMGDNREKFGVSAPFHSRRI